MLFVASAVLLGKKITNTSRQQDTERKNQSVCPDGEIPDKKDILMHDGPLFVCIMKNLLAYLVYYNALVQENAKPFPEPRYFNEAGDVLI